MIYLYKCNMCKSEQHIIKSMDNRTRDEYCKDCNSMMERKFTIPATKTADGFKTSR